MTSEHHSQPADTATETAAYPDPGPTGNGALDHIVVIMFENRSFDNIFGYLYKKGEPRDGQHFEGLDGGHYFNRDYLGEEIPAHIYNLDFEAAMRSPEPDPGEEYQHVNIQLYDTIIPDSNAELGAQEMKPPYNLPENGTVNMMGFVKDYFHQILNETGDKELAFRECRQIMGSFEPETMLPVLSTLAKGFAVYDHWFSAVPSQTFCNRAFFHASTSSGYVTNLGKTNDPDSGPWGIEKWWRDNDANTIFNLLEDQGHSWTIYYDKEQMVSITGMINAQALKPYHKTSHFKSMDEFYEDVKSGNLPKYAFIEPRQVYWHNDMHPAIKFEYDGKKESAGYDMRAGEVLLHDVYTAIRNTGTQPGSNTENTTLVVTFDEHGGTYDHVPPPKATPPEMRKPAECDFKFDRLGVRVPTIVISAFTEAGTIVNDTMSHASVMATLRLLYGLPPLTARDDGAPHIGNAFNRTTPRSASTWPVTTPHARPTEPEFGPFTGKVALTPLTPPARSLLALLVSKYGEPGEKTPENYGEAHEVLHRLGKGLFGQQAQPE